MLFSEPEAARGYFTDPKIVPAMQGICRDFRSPEEINEGRESHPSHRLMQIAPAYQKTLHGPLLALEMGLTVIR
ncbi:MAG: DUF4276 family protein, partial [Gammaproteobacteria bacterium]|nr:DUF4276 family protein [Gammaproteobacteria bacterium]